MKTAKPTFVLGKACMAVALLCALAGRAFAGSAGETSLSILKLDMGPRAMGMGGAYTALSGDVFGLNYNPAGLAAVKTLEIGGSFYKGISDTKMQYYGLAFPLPFYGVGGAAAPRMAFGMLFSQNGNIDWYQLNADGTARRSGEARSAGGDFIFTASYSEKVHEGNLAMSRYSKTRIEHNIGFSAKLISSRLPNTDGTDVKASAVTIDAGYLANLLDYNMSFGVSASNASGEITYISDSSKLPFILRTGMAYKGLSDVTGRGVVFSADYLRYYHEEANRVRLGAEFQFDKHGALRMGYRLMEDDGSGFTFGGGATLSGIQFDAGVALGGDLDTKFQMGLTYKFPKFRMPVREIAPPEIIDMDSSGRSAAQLQKRRQELNRLEKMRDIQRQKRSDSEARRREAEYAERILREQQQMEDSAERERSRSSKNKTDRTNENSIMLY